MGYGTQKLERMSLFLQGVVVRVGPAQNLQFIGVEFDCLAPGRGFLNLSLDLQ
jgi:hypothetical protein